MEYADKKDLNNLKVSQLSTILRNASKKVSGKKAELVDRVFSECNIINFIFKRYIKI